MGKNLTVYFSKTNVDLRKLSFIDWYYIIGMNLSLCVHMFQVSGKYHPSNFIYFLVMYTSSGRSLMAGQPYQVDFLSATSFNSHRIQTRTLTLDSLMQISFNMYPKAEGQRLLMLSGRCTHHGITAIASHWGNPNLSYANNTGNP